MSTTKQLFILLINSFTSIAISYFYFNYSNKQKQKDIDKKFETLFIKYSKLEHEITNINFKIQDINELVDEIEFKHLLQNKNNVHNTNNVQNLNNIEEYIMLVK
jgi:hypothetical protein|uniref:Uncharacterized protein n=1 Tax=viral metagenome TaxID=1070528 RepID=A0A6C0DW91_9ZZZZ